ncbi:MAG: hypothetical protein Kow0090_21370 [Myxococcota bacterium]
MKSRIGLIELILIATLLSPLFWALDAGAETAATPTPVSSQERWIDLSAVMQTVILWKSDSDFDATKPKYDEDGQTIGIAATLFQPKLALNVYKNLRLYYELELGLNVWSKNDPDQYDPTADDAFFLKHREAYSEGSFLSDRLGFKVGYQHYRDPTGLFLADWLGAATLWAKLDETKLSLTFGQAPDATYEGFIVTENNFVHDTFTLNLLATSPIAKSLILNAGVFSLIDSHVIGRSLWLVNPLLSVVLNLDNCLASLSAMLQFGRSEFGVADVDARHFAWAIEAHGELYLPLFALYLNGLLLSPDDEYNRNDFNGAFYYSGKNRSATLLLTENEVRDRYDNYDERMGVKDGGFYLLRTGLFVFDAKLESRVWEIFRPALISGVALALEPKNALDNRFVGTEIDADMAFYWERALSFHLIGGVFLPGEAGAALINDIDRESEEKVFFLETSLSVVF